MQFVIRIEKKKDWLHNQHAWSIQLLKIPGVKLVEVRNDNELIKRATYRVDYKKCMLLGQGVQHFDTLYILLSITYRLSTWSNVLLTGLIGLAGVIIMFLLPNNQIKTGIPAKIISSDTILSKQPDFLENKFNKKSVSEKNVTSLIKPEKKSYIKNTGALNNPSKREIIIAIGEIPDSLGQSGDPVKEDSNISFDLSSILENKKYTTYYSFFSPSIYADGVFKQISGANFSTVSLSSLNTHADELCIGTIWRNTHPSTSQKSMYVAEIQLRMKFIALEDGTELRQIDKTISQAGFSPELALVQATDALKQFLIKTL